MQFSDIIIAVQDAWNFIWPPLVLCGIAYFVSHFFNANGTNGYLEKLVALGKDYGSKLEDLRALLEPYGLNRFVPVVSLVLAIAFFYLLNVPLTAAVSSLPPHLSYRPDQLIGETMSNEERLLLLRKYPTAESFNQAYYLALEDAESETEVVTRRNRAEIYYKIHDFLKFALVVAVVIVVINMKLGLGARSQLTKLVVMGLLLGVLWFGSLLGLLYHQEQQFYDEWSPIHLSLQKDAATILSEPATDDETGRLEVEKGVRWWQVYLFDPYLITWMRRTLFPGI
jgi:hypothetical protein